MPELRETSTLSLIGLRFAGPARKAAWRMD
jgi:hypothetical protein